MSVSGESTQPLTLQVHSVPLYWQHIVLISGVLTCLSLLNMLFAHGAQTGFRLLPRCEWHCEGLPSFFWGGLTRSLEFMLVTLMVRGRVYGFLSLLAHPGPREATSRQHRKQDGTMSLSAVNSLSPP